MPNQLHAALERYEAAIESLEKADAAIRVEQVLGVLNARDAVQVALKQQFPISNSQQFLRCRGRCPLPYMS
ncbi:MULTISPECIES: hypothetical protein [unclassified Coleofasciculus]|uniref:hypothetical protein n=1 Tax=unclassified Coleofasciculus TaxID=2692782 RepID=UPI0018824D15|nr:MULTISPECIES: hypothetical protein [unclassified Coleofasciculus]MBE9130273.1 hypothetical protein [Coleofasciculus sp. LEGE 07081]MBE9151573.1 hypothetical protein [Coleofasciculus sp. LEGE 07092]